MKPKLPRLAGLLVLLCLAGISRGATSSQVTLPHARFTVITPQLIRLEYSPEGKFIDQRSWFAVNRDARFAGATIAQSNDGVAIDTGLVRLQYHDDGKPFSAENLSANIRRGDAWVAWTPGDKQTNNLGGTLRTVDGLHFAVRLPDGLISRSGWYLLDDSRSALFTDNWMAARPQNGNLDWYLFGYGLDYKSALKSLTTIGGPIPMPRKYTLGIWYSRYWSYTSEEFKQIVQQYDQHGFPLDVLVIDMGWHLNDVPSGFPFKVDTWTGYTWDSKLIPDPAALLFWLHQHGLHVTLNDHPAAGVQPHEEMYRDFMAAMGADPSGGAVIPFDAGSRKYLETFYRFTHEPREKQGVDFWWLDWQQYPFTRSIAGLENQKILNWFNFTRTSAGGQRGVSFSRWAGWGDHRYPIDFSGDADTGWKMLAFEVPFTSTAGNVGAFFWSHDIGGHMGGRNEESYTRWCQFGALSAALRSHSTHDATTDRRPWNYPDWAESSMRTSFRLRARLMPYLYTAIRQATLDSVPFIRPMYLDHPAEEVAYHQAQEYQFGDNLLVAPIATPGVGPARIAAQAVWFPPEDDWFDFFSGEKFAGGEHAVATAPIGAFPLFVRGGVPLPMQPFTPRPGTAPLTTLILRCYPGRDDVVGKSSVYEDDGISTGYQRGEFSVTPLTYVRHGDDVTLTVGPASGGYPGQPKSRAVVIELPCTLAGATADVGDVSYDAASHLTRIALPAAAVGEGRTIKISALREVPAEQIVAEARDAKLKQLSGDGVDASDPKIRQMISAVSGTAILPVNQHPYGLVYDVAWLYLHNHAAGAQSFVLTDAGGTARPITVSSGDTLVPAPATEEEHPLLIHRQVTLSQASGKSEPMTIEANDVVPLSSDLAMKATATASSGNAPAAIDGSTAGYPGDQGREWVTNGEHAGAWLKLAWPHPVRVSHVYLYDRPNNDDHVVAGTLQFSDGSSTDVGSLPKDGTAGEVLFPAKDISWLKFTVTKVSQRTVNIGLAEIAVTGQ
jgi:hypothetical protein